MARVLAALGQDVLVTGLAGGPTGQAVEARPPGRRAAARLVGIAADSRTTLVVADLRAARTSFAVSRVASGTALFNEPGPRGDSGRVRADRRPFHRWGHGGRAVVISGSLPRGVPADFYATLAATRPSAGCRRSWTPTARPCGRASAGRPAIVKPNAEELARAVPADGPRSRVAGRAARTAGAAAVVVSLGADGLLAVTAEGIWRARMPYRVAGEPDGGG